MGRFLRKLIESSLITAGVIIWVVFLLYLQTGGWAWSGGLPPAWALAIVLGFGALLLSSVLVAWLRERRA